MNPGGGGHIKLKRLFGGLLDLAVADVADSQATDAAQGTAIGDHRAADSGDVDSHGGAALLLPHADTATEAEGKDQGREGAAGVSG